MNGKPWHSITVSLPCDSARSVVNTAIAFAGRVRRQREDSGPGAKVCGDRRLPLIQQFVDVLHAAFQFSRR